MSPSTRHQVSQHTAVDGPAAPSEQHDDTGTEPTANGTTTEPEDSAGAEEAKEHGTKRKASPSGDDTPHKASRRSSPASPSPEDPVELSPAEQVKLVNFLLSPHSLPFARPKDEAEDLKKRPNGGAKTRTYATSPFTPFEELLCALVLSRPIGHMLGLRTIRTILNPPYFFMSPKLIRDTGVDGVRQALVQARTQHRQKTAEEIVLLTDAVHSTLGEDHFDVSLEKVREVCERDAKKEREMLRENVKGMGDTGLDIFARRIQGLWEEWYPFADQRTLQALGKLGLPSMTEELRKLLEEKGSELNVEDVVGDGEERTRRVFVRVVERAIGADLEGNLDEMKAKGLE